MAKYLVFAFIDWEDQEGRGWDAFLGSPEGENLTDIRRWLSEKNNGVGEHGNAYQIVDYISLQLLEKGAIQYDWAADGNTVINSRAAAHCSTCAGEGLRRDERGSLVSQMNDKGVGPSWGYEPCLTCHGTKIDIATIVPSGSSWAKDG